MSNPAASISETPPTSHSSNPSWAPPKSPLPPHRLAKLANALGVSTPLPAMHHPPPTPSRVSSPSLSVSNNDPYFLHRGSPSPSLSASTHNLSAYAPSTSKYLLHVIPPLKLPHDSDSDAEIMLPLPSSSGYHSQFRRGVFVPVHSTLQSQLWAIAKEYALPSTAGLVLYLVSSNPRSSPQPGDGPDNDIGEPGPRMSEEIWKHLWTRVLKVEQREDTPSRTLSPSALGLGLGLAARSTPQLVSEPSPLRPLFSLNSVPGRHEHVLSQASAYPSPSTPSTTSHNAPHSSSSLSLSSAGTDTPDTSVEDSEGGRGNSLDLPGLNSSSLIPILAKVEFDIDRRKAAWFDPWLRSRKVNHAKRSRKPTGDLGQGKPPLTLKLPGRSNSGPAWLSEGKEGDADDVELTESPIEKEETEDSDDATARVASVHQGMIEQDYEVTEGASPVPRKSSLASSLHRSMSRKNAPPPLVLHPPNGPLPAPVPAATENSTDLAIPSPLPTAESPGSTSLPYLQGTSEDDVSDPEGLRSEEEELYTNVGEESAQYGRLRTSDEKRGGGVYDDLDLGLDPSMEFDENDPDDHRKSQYLFKAQLDVIEKKLAQFSPRVLEAELEQEQGNSLAAVAAAGSSNTNADIFPPTPTVSSRLNNPADSGAQPSWPAIPFSQLNNNGGDSPPPSVTRRNAPPSPPRLAVNGVSTSVPKNFNPRLSLGELSAETKKRRKALEEEQNLAFPGPTTPRNGASDSPIIPLSPDPFGRFPSAGEAPAQHNRKQSSTYWEKAPSMESIMQNHQSSSRVSQDTEVETKSSRFSADSLQGIEAPVKSNRSTVMSVKSIKKLWRRSNKQSVSAIPPAPTQTPGRLSPQDAPQPQRMNRSPSVSTTNIPLTPTFGTFPSNMPPQRPERPSPENMDIPDIPDQLMIPAPPQILRSPGPSPIIPSKMLPSRTGTPLDRLQFDQESPYPTPRRTVYTRPPSPSQQQQQQQQQQSQRPQASTPPLPENQKSTMRKSILKWKSAASVGATSHHQQTPSMSSTFNEPIPSPPLQKSLSGSGVRARRPSVTSFTSTGSMRQSLSGTSTPEIPPSPKIPEQYLNGRLNPATMNRPSHLTNPSMDSTLTRSTSPASSSMSRLSEDTRPSIDSSQFEIVSPKTQVGSLSYPYTTMDQQ